MSDLTSGVSAPRNGPITGSTPVSIAVLVLLVAGAFSVGVSLGKAHTRMDGLEDHLRTSDSEHVEFRRAIRNLEIIAARMEGENDAVAP